jgi:hypothetical protein
MEVIPMTPAEREQRRLAANVRWSRQDPRPFMEMVRQGQNVKWEREVREEAEGPLSEGEIARRIDAKRRAHQNRMTLAALAAARRNKARGPAA